MLRRLACLAAFGALFTLAGSAAASDDDRGDDKPKARTGSVVRPADTHTDPKTGAQTVLVPSGCTPTTRPNGQVVIFCPYKEPRGEPHSHYDTKWYGWEILVLDGASLVAGTLLMAAGDDAAPIGASVLLGGYVLGGPIVHWSNGQVGKGFGSLGLRIGAPMVVGLGGLAVGAVLGAAACSSHGDGFCVVTSSLVGGLIGMGAGGVAAVAIDAAALARKKVLVPDEPQEQAKRPTFTWQPMGGYDPKRQTATLGIGGTF